MPNGDHPLTHPERSPISALKSTGRSQRPMADQLGRDVSTISRELRRNRGQRGDRHQPAQGKATSWRRAASAVPWKMTPERWAVVEDRLQAGWSPEQIAGRFQQQGEVMAGREWIYPSVRADRPAGGDLDRCLRRRGKKPNGRGGRHAGRGHLPGRVDIAERPAIGEAKGRIGDWELDLIMGVKHRGAWISWGDRASKYLVLVGVAGKTAAAVTEAIVRRMGPIRDRVHTCTADNGKEFAGHREVAKALGADFYFATPYHSWERGLNEHTNGLVRQSFPKGTDFRQVTASQVQAVEERINRRPRKMLGVRTPQEVFTAVAPP